MSDDDFDDGGDGYNGRTNGTASTRAIDSRSEAEGETERKSLNRLFDALGNDRRRSILSYLREPSGDAASVAELTMEIAERESADDASVQRGIEDVAVSLHHVHLPKLEATGLVDYDARNGAVSYRENSKVEAVLEIVGGDAR